MKTAKEIGAIGEDIAEKYLKKHFWRIIARNYRESCGEIDIVGYRGGTLVFFEVKTRSNDLYGTPASAVDDKKLDRIQATAYRLLEKHSSSGRIPVFYPLGVTKMRPVRRKRIDVIEVLTDADYKPLEINHIKDWGKDI